MGMTTAMGRKRKTEKVQRRRRPQKYVIIDDQQQASEPLRKSYRSMDDPTLPATTVEDATAAMDLSADDDAAALPTGGGEPMETEKESGKTEDPVPSDPIALESDEKDSDNVSTTSSSEAADEGISPEKAEIMLIKATGLKEEGNKNFKEGENDKAARAYRRGVNSLKKLNKNNTGDDQVKALLVTLHTNLSMVMFKNGKFRQSASVAGQALAIDAKHVKSLYRRAVANRKLGNLEESRTDLRAAIAVDANNTVCKKELVAIKKELQSFQENQKKALAKAFNPTGKSFLYNDKEAAEKRKEEEERLKKVQEEELVKKRKAQWEDDCVALMAKQEPAISFEDWDKQRVEKEAAELAEKEKAKKEADKLRRQAKKAAKAAEPSEKDESDDELTESELKMMRGYKKTADGRTTSYFSREQSEEEKARALVANAPKRLQESAAGAAPGVPQDASAVRTSSAWNQAGTWEEKDTTTWCTTQLRKRLQDTCASTDELNVDVVSVEELTGDASVAMVSEKKRYIFDYHVKLKYEIKEADVVVASGLVRLPDICSTHHDEIEVVFESWTKKPKSEMLVRATSVRDSLATQLRANSQLFVQDFNNMY